MAILVLNEVFARKDTRTSLENKWSAQAERYLKAMTKRHYAQFILANYPEAREDDSKLLLYHLRRMGCHLSLEQSRAFLNAFKDRSADMLIRDRQWFNEHGEYLPENPRVIKARRRKEVQVRMELKEPIYKKIYIHNPLTNSYSERIVAL